MTVTESLDDHSVYGAFSEGGRRLPVRLFSTGPSEGKLPLLIFLHGAGQRGDDNRSQLEVGIGDLTATLRSLSLDSWILAPQCPVDDQWTAVDWSVRHHTFNSEPTAPLRALLHGLAVLRSRPGIDRERIYLAGISMGGFGVWDLLVRRPEWFAGALICCGGGDRGTIGRAAGVPQTVFHREADPVVPVDCSRDMVRELRAAGADLIYRELPGEDHDCWTEAFTDRETVRRLYLMHNHCLFDTDVLHLHPDPQEG